MQRPARRKAVLRPFSYIAHQFVRICDDCLAAAASANDYLYGANNTNTLAKGNAVPNAILTVAKVLAKHNFRLGGIFGGEFVTGNVCMVLPYNRQTA